MDLRFGCNTLYPYGRLPREDTAVDLAAHRDSLRLIRGCGLDGCEFSHYQHLAAEDQCALRDACETGVSLLRPMYLDHPEADAAYEAQGQYYFGDDLIKFYKVTFFYIPFYNSSGNNAVDLLRSLFLPKGDDGAFCTDGLCPGNK